MAHAHLGHDVTVGDNCEICTGVILGGYSTIEDGARIKLGVTVRNRLKVGKDAVVGMGAVVVKNVTAGSTVVGNPAKEISTSKLKAV